MENPFFRSHWNYPNHPRPRYMSNMMEVPVQRRTMPVSPKVVSIPVRFVASDKSRSDSATKIQKVFRGFLVRKSVKKVVGIKREVDEIERMLSEKGTVELIRNDAKEKLKFSEMLMSLLFRLDSVKGVDSGVRDLRKAVIKKAIALQEKVDSIVVEDKTTGVTDGTLEVGEPEISSEVADQRLEEFPALEARTSEHEPESSAAANCCDPLEAHPETGIDDEKAIDSTLKNGETAALSPCSTAEEETAMVESTLSSSELKVATEIPTAYADDSLKVIDSEPNENTTCCGVVEEDESPDIETVSEPEKPEEIDEDDNMSETESQTDSSGNPPNLMEEDAENGGVDSRETNENEEEHVQGDSRINGREEEKQSRELLEKMIMENKKMMEMMTDLFERNEIQTQMLSSLSQRVEQLEKAFVYETLRRKKKRNGTAIDSSGGCQKTKKCGK